MDTIEYAEEFLNASEQETTTAAIIAQNITNSVMSNKYVDPLFNKYVIIGALLIMACLFLASVFYYYMKTDNNSCCHDEHGSHLYNVVSDDASSLIDDDDPPNALFVSCQLYVDDSEINTASGYEYDCRSIDGCSIEEEERTLLISQKQKRYEALPHPDACSIHSLP